MWGRVVLQFNMLASLAGVLLAFTVVDKTWNVESTNNFATLLEQILHIRHMRRQLSYRSGKMLYLGLSLEATDR